MTEFKSWRSFWHFENIVRRQLRYVRTQDTEEFLSTVAETSHYRQVTMRAGRILWRAQLGYDLDEFEQEGETIIIEQPCSSKRMKPLADRASSGRANPVGIPCLYLATHEETAMCEVRPWMGSLISVAQFRLLRDCKIVDCSRDHAEFPIYFEEPPLAEKRTAVWANIDRAFAEPTTPQDGIADYVPTQILAELFKREGYDGVAYKSNFGEAGYNVALFDLNSADLINCFLHEVTKVEMQFKQRGNPYFVKKYYEDKAKDTLETSTTGEGWDAT
jgi:hypothetical protein